jgi:DNA modification methylase
MKPVALISKALRNSSRVGDTVADFFGGWGSTLIACENLKCRARVVELDPRYCDVIVKRWERFTGQKVVRTKP